MGRLPSNLCGWSHQEKRPLWLPSL